jgi:hypothetical protein
VLSAVVTTSASSATMNDATDVSANTQVLPAFSLNSAMASLLDRKNAGSPTPAGFAICFGADPRR